MRKLASPFVLIKKSWEIFSIKKNLVTLVQLYLPLGLVSLISLLFVKIPFLSDFLKTDNGNTVVVALDLLFAVVSVFVGLAGIIAIIEITNGKSVQVKKVFKQATSKFWKYFLLVFVTGLIYVFGSILLVFPLILFLTWFAFGRFIFVENGTGIKSSLLESKKMVKGIFWKVFARLLVFGIFSLCMEITFGMLPLGIGDVALRLLSGFFLIPQYLLYREILSGKEPSKNEIV